MSRLIILCVIAAIVALINGPVLFNCEGLDEKSILTEEAESKMKNILRLNEFLKDYVNDLKISQQNDITIDKEKENEVNGDLFTDDDVKSNIKTNNLDRESQVSVSSNEMHNKRSHAYLRFGKSGPAYLRFGRAQAFLRFGKRAPGAYLRFGKRNPAYLRFGRSAILE